MQDSKNLVQWIAVAVFLVGSLACFTLSIGLFYGLFLIVGRNKTLACEAAFGGLTVLIPGIYFFKRAWRIGSGQEN
jgi:hypothetical protein